MLVFWIRYNAEPEDAAPAEIVVHDEPDQPEQTPKASDPEAVQALFKQKVEKTLNMYDDIKYFIDGEDVTVIIDVLVWNNTKMKDQDAFMNEIYSLVRIDAIESGILDQGNAKLFFMTSDYKNTHYYKIEKE